MYEKKVPCISCPLLLRARYAPMVAGEHIMPKYFIFTLSVKMMHLQEVLSLIVE